MSQPATGAAVIFGTRRELAPGVPDVSQSREYYHPVPPLVAALIRSQTTSPEINPSGFMQKPVPGAITGPLDLAVLWTAANFLPILEAITGNLAQTEPEADVFQYVSTPEPFGADPTFDAILCRSPVDRQRLSLGKISGATVVIGNNVPLAMRLAGFLSFDTHLGVGVADVGNTGTFTMGPPDIRGNLRRPRSGEFVAVDITRTVASGGIQYKAERVPNGGTATFPGVAIDAAYDTDGNGTWQALVVAYQGTGTVSVGAGTAAVTGVGTAFLSEFAAGEYITIAGENRAILSIASNTALTLATNHTAGASGVKFHRLLDDAGYWTENYDPVEIIFPGDSSDHADLDVGDLYTYPTTWTDPTPTYIAGQRYTSAHWKLDWRRQGDTTWNPFQVQTGNWTLAKAVTPSQGSGSRHYFSLDREGLLNPALQVVRKYLDDTFLEFERSHEPLELRLRWEGQKLGTGAYRESITAEYSAATVMSRTAPVAGPTAIIETVNFAFPAADDGSEPVIITVITDRDYTPVP